MAGNIERVTFENAAEKLRDQIKTAFVELIPEDQWNDMVRKELETFFKERSVREHGSYGDWIKAPSRFNELVKEIFDAEVKNRVAWVIKSGHWHPDKGSFWEWDHFESIVSYGVKKWLNDNAEMLTLATVKSLIGNAAQSMLSYVASQYKEDLEGIDDANHPNYQPNRHMKRY